jgi:hypothetical protein
MDAPSTSASPTSEASQMTQLMQAMLELLQKNAAPAVVLQPQPPAPVFRPEELLRTFAGEPREDPEVFIADIEAYFDKVGAVYLTPRHQILVAYRQLRGDAEKRNRYYKNIDQRVEELWDRLRRDYGADSQSQQLLATFMGATYKKTEPLDSSSTDKPSCTDDSSQETRRNNSSRNSSGRCPRQSAAPWQSGSTATSPTSPRPLPP